MNKIELVWSQDVVMVMIVDWTTKSQEQKKSFLSQTAFKYVQNE